MGKWAVIISSVGSVEGKVPFSATKLRVLWKIQKYME